MVSKNVFVINNVYEMFNVHFYTTEAIHQRIKVCDIVVIPGV